MKFSIVLLIISAFVAPSVALPLGFSSDQLVRMPKYTTSTVSDSAVPSDTKPVYTANPPKKCKNKALPIIEKKPISKYPQVVAPIRDNAYANVPRPAVYTSKYEPIHTVTVTVSHDPQPTVTPTYTQDYTTVPVITVTPGPISKQNVEQVQNEPFFVVDPSSTTTFTSSGSFSTTLVSAF